MAYVYQCKLSKPAEGATTIPINVTVGTRTLRFTFQWAIASAEQFDAIERYLKNKANGDPLDEGGEFNRDYDYLAFYTPLINMSDDELVQWLNESSVLPRNIEQAPSISSKLSLLHSAIAECAELDPVVRQYKEVMRWQFKMIYNNEVTTGVVTTGGWYRNQAVNFDFRFVSDLKNIGYEDLGNVTMEFEVYDD